MYWLISICFSLIIMCCASELNIDLKSNNHPYNIDALFKNHFQNSMKIKNQRVNIQYNPVYNNILFKSPNLFQNSSKCLQDLLYTVTSLKNMSNQWALHLFDSYGKPDSGILEGSIKWPGDYSECIQVYAPSKPDSTAGNFHGQYCSLSWSLTLSNTTLPLTSGVCIPDSCSSSQLKGRFFKLLKVLDVSASEETKSALDITSLNCLPTERHLSTPAKAVIALLAFFCTLAVLGSSITAAKYFLQTKQEIQRQPPLVVNIPPNDLDATPEDSLKKTIDTDDVCLLQNDSENQTHGSLRKVEAFLGCFCIFKNGAKLLNTDSTEGELLCIHGIRFLSMSWVILGHAYVFCFSEIKNTLQAMQMINNFPFTIVLQGFYSVDSFFVLSGFLLTYLSMREFSKRKGGIAWPYFYIHRYLRLTPVYMITLGFSASIFYYLGSGPFWPAADKDPNCEKTWWWNLLYINNFKNGSEQCMGWAWYLANDMQFFVISPLFLITLWRWPKIGYFLLELFLCATCLANFFLTYHYDLLPGAMGFFTQDVADILKSTSRFMEYFNKMYTKPYTRIGPYLVGMLAGYVLFARKINNKPPHNWVTLGLGWAVATGITLTCVYGLYHANPSLVARSFYNGLNRSCYAAGLCWVIYVCLIEQGGFVNSILSYKLFIPLSRLTYTAYLIHPLIITGYYGSLKTAFFFSHTNVVLLYLGFMVVTYGLALPVALILESPVISLEKMIRKSFSKD